MGCTPTRMASPLPVIDLSLLDSGDEASVRRFGLQVESACRRVGAFYLVNHGLSEKLIHSVQKGQRDFFALPAEKKRDLKLPEVPKRSKGFVRGYLGVGAESGSQQVEIKEAFSFGYNWDENKIPTNPLQGPNVWPDEETADQDFHPEHWKRIMCSYFDSACRVARKITQGMALALGYTQNALDGQCIEGHTISLCRLFHYFPYESLAHDDHSALGTDPNTINCAAKAVGSAYERGRRCVGSSEHTDWGWLTLILAEVGPPGLQVFDRTAQEWVDVPGRPGSLIVICGDYVSLLTTGEFHSPVHRVTTPKQERHSTVFFFYPNFDATLPSGKGSKDNAGTQTYSLWSNQNEEGKVNEDEKKYSVQKKAPTSFGEFLLQKWASVQRKGDSPYG